MNELTNMPPAGSAATLLCVDDESNILSSLRRLFRQDGYRVLIATSGAEGLRLLECEAVDLVISDMRMPEMDGVRFLGQVRARWPHAVRILLTGYADIASTVAAINQGEIYRYIAKPWDDDDVRLIVRHALERKLLEREKARLEALTQRQNEQLQALNASLEAKVQERTAELSRAHDALAATNEKLKTNFLTSIKVFSNLTELAEGARAGHSRRVADLGRRIAMKLGLEGGATQDVMVAGLLHDIGKIGLPDALLAKSAPQMSAGELRVFKKHPIKGEAALMALEDLRAAARLLRSHHERYDGFGYPDGLSGLAIPLGARILAVANDYDGLQIGSLSVKRLSAGEAGAFIQQSSGKRYDSQVVDAFLALLGGEGAGKVTRELALGPSELKPGMVLSRDLINRDGALLLAADFLLDDNFIKQINGYARGEEVRIVIH
ncbi:MAG: HD domain-containing phosphohydrolase, partial [Burkholderiales bacterium]